MHLVKFINLEEYENDLIVSFAVSDGEQDIRSLILLRTLLYEELLEKYERGVHVSFEGITNEQEQPIILKEVVLKNSEIELTTDHYSFNLDLSKIESSEIESMMSLIEKQNHDNSFVIRTA